jgi:hypothetical protein
LHAIQKVFAPLNEAMLELYSKYSREELQTVLDYVTHSNRILRILTENLRKPAKEEQENR